MKVALLKHVLSISLALLYTSSFSATVSFDLSATAGVLQQKNLAGTCLPIWNNQTIYKQIKKGLMQSNYRLFRFPNGSLSNGYHWNGKGANNSDSIWVCDSQAFLPGFMSMTINRGTSVSNWGFDMSSNITDGDTTTSWRSDELITGSLPYFYLELPASKVVDSIVILWGDKYAADFSIDFFTLATAPYPGPFGISTDSWESQKLVTDNQQSSFSSAIPGGKSTRYVRVNIKKYRDQKKSVEVREVYLFSQGTLLTKNVKKFSGGATDDQTRVIAMPTHEGSTLRPATEYTTGSTGWSFEAFMDYIRSMSDSAVPVICVNYSTGTPQEAAAWVHYANVVKNYNIRFWQIGNEMDGAWEEGGPVTARMYAEKFLLFSKAMKKVDSTIKILGPLLSSAQFDAQNSGLYDGRNWMRAFIDSIGREEKADNAKYCDGIDFHSYPYWFTTPTIIAMRNSMDFVYNQSDSLKRWIALSLAKPESVYVMMSEYNSSTVMSDFLQRSFNGIFVANMCAGLAEKFGSRAMSVFWDSYEDGSIGSNNTFGSLSLFNTLDIWRWSSLGKAPSSAYWGLFNVLNIWLDSKKENTYVPALSNSKTTVRTYGVKTPDDFRALFFNTALQPETLTCSLSTNRFTKADIYTWGENQFKWIGNTKTAYAFPNCGPISQTVASSDLKLLILPPLSMGIVRFREADTAKQTPQILHLWAYPNTGSSQILPVCGSAFGGTEVITGINYAFDTAGTFSRSLRSLDSAYDGPFESFFDSIPVQSLSGGQHKMYVQARTASGGVCLDSLSFSVSKAGILSWGRNIQGPDGWNILESKTRHGIQLTLNSPLKTSGNGPLIARVVSSNGACIKELTSTRKNGYCFEWAGGTGAHGRAGAAPGAYFIVISNEGKVVYRTTMVVSK
jgi:hypothetical protein